MDGKSVRPAFLMMQLVGPAVRLDLCGAERAMVGTRPVMIASGDLLRLVAYDGEEFCR